MTPLCTCSHIMLDARQTDARNWEPECPMHGVASTWYQSDAQITKRQLDSVRLRVTLILAKLRRDEAITVEAAKIIQEAL